MKQKINYRNAEECIHATYNDMKAMTLDDAVFILSEIVRKYHEAKNDRERVNLTRARIIKAYEIMLNIVNQPDMREKVKEYISELDVEIDRCNHDMEELSRNESFEGENNIKINYCIVRAKTIMQIQNDLKSRLEELV